MSRQNFGVSWSMAPRVVVEVRIHIAPSLQKHLHSLRPTLEFRVRVPGREHLSRTVKPEIDEVRSCLDFRCRISARVRNDECRAMFAQDRLHLFTEARSVPKFHRETSRARASCILQEFIDRFEIRLRRNDLIIGAKALENWRTRNAKIASGTILADKVFP